MKHAPKILVCTDFSSYSDDALKAAEKMRAKMNGSLKVIHVSEYAVMWDWMPTMQNKGVYQLDLLNTLRTKIEDQMQKLGLNAESIISQGVTSSVILEEIEHNKIDIVVVGHKGKTGKFHLGSIAEKIIASSPIPVLVVKGNFELSKVAALIDPNGMMEEIINWGEEISSKFGTKFEIISLFPDIAGKYIGIGKFGFSTELLALTEEQKKNIVIETTNDIKRKIKKSSHVIIRVEISAERKIAYHLNNIMIQDKVDLSIMKRHQSELLEKILIGSETRRMIEIFTGSILILPP